MLQRLRRVGTGTLSEPGAEDVQLVAGRMEKYDAHAHSLVDVNHLSFGCEAPLTA